MQSTEIIAISAAVAIVSGILSSIGTAARLVAGLKVDIDEKQELKRQLALAKQKAECNDALHTKLDAIDQRMKRIEAAVNGKNGKNGKT